MLSILTGVFVDCRVLGGTQKSVRIISFEGDICYNVCVSDKASIWYKWSSDVPNINAVIYNSGSAGDVKFSLWSPLNSSNHCYRMYGVDWWSCWRFVG